MANIGMPRAVNAKMTMIGNVRMNFTNRYDPGFTRPFLTSPIIRSVSSWRDTTATTPTIGLQGFEY